MYRYKTSHLRRALFPLLLIVVCALVLLLMIAGVACDDDQALPAGADAAPDESRPLSFTTEDGITLGGHLFGDGDTGIILAHMYPTDQTSWYATAEKLAEVGYLVLTFDFRGYGESEGSKDIPSIAKDVAAAVEAVRTAETDHMASEVILVGASMGGTACLISAETFQAFSSFRLAGVVTLSAPVEFKGLSAAEAVPVLQVPLLFIAAEDDVGAEGAQELQRLSGGHGRMQIFPGGDHGTDLLKGEAAEQVWDLLVDFLNENAMLVR